MEATISRDSIENHETDTDSSTAVVEQSHTMQSLLGERSHGRVTDYTLEVNDGSGNIPIEQTDDGSLYVPETANLFRNSTFQPTNTSELSRLEDLQPEVISNGVQVDIPVQGTEEYVTVTAEITVHLKLECTDLVEPIYYQVELADCSLANVYAHTYLDRDPFIMDHTHDQSESVFQEQTVRVWFCDMDTIRLEQQADTILGKVRQTIGTPFIRSQPDIVVPKGYVHPHVGIVLMLGIVCLLGTVLYIPLSVVLPEPILTLFLFSLIVGCLGGIGLLLLMKVMRSYTHQFNNTTDSNMDHHTVSGDKQLDITSVNGTEQMTVEIQEKKGSVYIVSEDDGTQWKLPENSSVLEEQSIEFIRSLGIETVESSDPVTVETSKNELDLSNRSVVQVDESRFFYK